jgi:hypothetical protein
MVVLAKKLSFDCDSIALYTSVYMMNSSHGTGTRVRVKYMPAFAFSLIRRRYITQKWYLNKL